MELDPLVDVDNGDPLKVVLIKVTLLHSLVARMSDRKSVLLSVARNARAHTMLLQKQLDEANKELTAAHTLNAVKNDVGRRQAGKIEILTKALHTLYDLLSAEPLEWLTEAWIDDRSAALKNARELLALVPDVPK